MSLVGCRQHFRVWLSAVLLAGFTGLAPAQADTVSIRLDQAHIMQLPDRVATIVIGNPLIADATLQGGGVLVVTGKGYGSTNLVALDRAGRVLLSHTVQVLGASAQDMVVVYKGIERETYSCASDCERRITLGDGETYFRSAIDQAGSLSGQASAAGTTKPAN